MKNRILRLCLLSALSLSILWTACSKNTSLETNPALTDTVKASTVNLLTLSAWKYDTSGYDNNKDGILDGAADSVVVPFCERDDAYTFYADNTGSMDNGTDYCVASDSRLVPFSWSYDSVKTMLTAGFNPVMQAGVTIQKLDSTQMWVYRDSTSAGVDYRYIVVFKH